MGIIRNDIDLPNNCVECEEKGIRGGCRLIFSGCANCGRHPNCPLKSTDKLIEEINIIGSTGWLDISTEEMIDIIHKYTDKEQENGKNSF